MAPSSLTDWIQTIVQFFTLIGVAWYTRITHLTLKASQKQNQSLSEQLRLQGEAAEAQRAAVNEASLPILIWNPFSGNPAQRLAVVHCQNKGEPISDISLHAEQITSQVTIEPTDYLDRDTELRLTLILPGPEFEGRQSFRFDLQFTTKTGRRVKTSYEAMVGGAPRKTGHVWLN